MPGERRGGGRGGGKGGGRGERRGKGGKVNKVASLNQYLFTRDGFTVQDEVLIKLYIKKKENEKTGVKIYSNTIGT